MTSTSQSAASTDSILGKTLVSVDLAIALSNHDRVKFVDGSWFLGGMDRNAKQEYLEGPRLPRARFLDIDEIATPTVDKLPHMMPSPSVFGATMDAYEILSSKKNAVVDHVIVYGSHDCMFVARGYWQFRVMGHPKEYCHLLDGSLDDWIKAGGPVEAAGSDAKYPIMTYQDAMQADPSSIQYQATEPQNIVSMDELKTILAAEEGKTGEAVTIVDVRSAARFKAEVDEPRPGLRLGHMPGAKNLFFMDLLDANNKVRLKSNKDELRQIIQNAGIDLPLSSNTKVIATCGSGATACVLLLALDVLGEDTHKLSLYDGSWVEWGSQPDTPIVV